MTLQSNFNILISSQLNLMWQKLKLGIFITWPMLGLQFDFRLKWEILVNMLNEWVFLEHFNKLKTVIFVLHTLYIYIYVAN